MVILNERKKNCYLLLSGKQKKSLKYHTCIAQKNKSTKPYYVLNESIQLLRLEKFVSCYID